MFPLQNVLQGSPSPRENTSYFFFLSFSQNFTLFVLKTETFNSLCLRKKKTGNFSGLNQKIGKATVFSIISRVKAEYLFKNFALREVCLWCSVKRGLVLWKMGACLVWSKRRGVVIPQI